MYENLRYRRGFLLTEGSDVDAPDPVADWEAVALGRFVLRTHPDLRRAVAGRGETHVVCLGRVFDPIGGVADVDAVLATLQDRLTDSDERFLDYLDRLGGRFVLLVVTDDRAVAVGDATGTRALFYDDTPTRCVLASHPEIVAEMGGYERTAGAARILDAEAPWFPGIATPYDEVKLLTPNTLLVLPETDVRRFFPRGPLPSTSLTDDLVAEVADVFTASVRLLDRQADLSLSLSAGLDSRLSLAATRDRADEVQYTTWVTGEADAEVATVRDLCEELGVDCAITDLSTDPDEAFREVFMHNTSGMSRWNRCRNAYNLHRRSRPDGDAVGIRSNVAEIARTFYRDRFAFLPDEAAPETMAKLYAYEAQSDYVRDAYEEFVTRTDFDRATRYGYDPYDLFYWECRIGAWLSLWLLETSVAQEEVSLYNDRWLLKRMLSVGYDRRRTDDLFYRVIRHLWPECLSVPINPHEESRIPGAGTLDRVVSGAVLRAPAPAYMAVRKLRRRA